MMTGTVQLLVPAGDCQKWIGLDLYICHSNCSYCKGL